METETQKLQRQIDELQKQIDTLKSSTTIPFDIDGAFRKRLGIESLVTDRELDAYIIASSKSASSENVTAVTSVNFVAETVGTNTVLDNPDGFLQIVISGTTYYLPYFT